MFTSKSGNLACFKVALLPISQRYHYKDHGKMTSLKEQQIQNREVLKKCCWAYFLSSWQLLQYWKAHALFWGSDVAILSCHLWMDSWLRWKHSCALNQAAALPGVRSTDIVVCLREFILVAYYRLTAILPKHDTRNSEIWDGEMGSTTVPGILTGWNHRSRLLEYEMHLPDDYYHTWYSSYHICCYV